MLCNRMVGSKVCMFAKYLTHGAMIRLTRTSSAPGQGLSFYYTGRGWEKNWEFFEANRELYVLHSLSPLVVMQCDISSGNCTDVYTSWATETIIRHPQLDEAFEYPKSRLSTPLVAYGENNQLGNRSHQDI